MGQSSPCEKRGERGGEKTRAVFAPDKQTNTGSGMNHTLLGTAERAKRLRPKDIRPGRSLDPGSSRLTHPWSGPPIRRIRGMRDTRHHGHLWAEDPGRGMRLDSA